MHDTSAGQQKVFSFSVYLRPARYQLETTTEIDTLQRLVLPLNKRIEASSWCLNEEVGVKYCNTQKFPTRDRLRTAGI